MKAERQQIVADGQCVAVVNIEICGQKGRFVPNGCPVVTFALEGGASIRGCGNGAPSYLGSDHPDKQPCNTFSIPAFNGRAQVLIQSGQQPSTVTLKCASDGLKYGLLTITTR